MPRDKMRAAIKTVYPAGFSIVHLSDRLGFAVRTLDNVVGRGMTVDLALQNAMDRAGLIWKDPNERYQELLEKCLAEIDSIDDATPGSPTEPEWWVQMMEFRSDASCAKTRLEVIEGRLK